MRHTQAESRFQGLDGSFLRRNAPAIQLALFYGAFALIVGIVLGSTSVHPF